MGVIFLSAFLLRVAVITIGHTYRITPRRDHFQFGWEMGRLARSIATGNGFSSPTDVATGPSAWAPPIYPYLLAGVFKIFGVYSAASGFVILSLNSFFAALTSLSIYKIAKFMYGTQAALWSAWAWAIFPYVIYWPTRVVWETSLTTFLLSVALLMTLSMGEARIAPHMWIFFGALWGLITLTNTALISMLPVELLWILWQQNFSKANLWGAVACIAVATTVVSPWIVRNYVVFDKFIFVRNNLPLELHMANNDGSEGLWTRNEHPANDAAAMRQFEELGEIGFMNEKQKQFQLFVHDHFGLFLKFTIARIFYFWAAPPSLTITSNGYDLAIARHTGFILGSIFAFAGLWLTLRKRIRGGFLLGCFLLLYPLPYYLVNPFPRYKAPIEPEMIMLIVYLLWEAKHVHLRVPFGKT